MTTAGNALCLEFWRLTRARVSPFVLESNPILIYLQWLFNRGMPMIPASFRAPTPLLVLQSVLIPGVFLSGFLLSPLLVLSRNIAGKPSHRLKVRPHRSAVGYVLTDLTVADGTRPSTQTPLSRNFLLIIRHRILPPRRLGELDARHDASRIPSPPTVDMGIRIHLLRRRIN